MQTATFGFRRIYMRLVTATSSIFGAASHIKIVFAAVAQHIHHIAGGYVERTDHASRQVKMTVGAKDYVRAACYSE